MFWINLIIWIEIVERIEYHDSGHELFPFLYSEDDNTEKVKKWKNKMLC